MWHGTGVDRLGIRGFKVTDGPNGARGAYFAGTTSACVPCGTALASTWNVELVGRVGELLGEETRSKGADILLGPTINIHRSPLAGRNFECYSEDPYLTARLAVAYIEGVQRTGVGTAVKHLAANDSEFERHTISSVVDERTLREITLPPFEAAIGEARSWSVMAAYNRLNGTYCSEHELLMSCVHDEWDLPGFVISDWWSVKSTDETGRHGCDLEMPGPYKYLGPKLAEAVEAGLVPIDALDGKVRRVLATMEALGVLDRPEHAADRSVDEPRHRELIRAAGREAVVLLTNRDVLPLDPSTLRRLAVIGPNADVAVIQGGGSAVVNPHYAVTVLDGLRARLGDDVEIVHERGVDGFRSAPPLDPRWTRPTDPSQPAHGFTVEYFDDLDLGGDPVHVAHSNSARLNWLGDPWPGVNGDHFSVRVTATFVAPEDGEFAISLIAGGKGTAVHRRPAGRRPVGRLGERHRLLRARKRRATGAARRASRRRAPDPRRARLLRGPARRCAADRMPRPDSRRRHRARRPRRRGRRRRGRRRRTQPGLGDRRRGPRHDVAAGSLRRIGRGRGRRQSEHGRARQRRLSGRDGMERSRRCAGADVVPRPGERQRGRRSAGG